MGGGPDVHGFEGDRVELKFGFYAYEADGSPANNPGPFADNTAPVITIISDPGGSPTQKTNLTVVGVVSDAAGKVGRLQAAIDNGFTQDVAFGPNGNFSLTTAFPLDGSQDGPHTIRFTAADTAENQANPVTVTFTLDSTVLAPKYNLTGVTDTGTLGDYITSVNNISILGKTDPFASLKLTETGATTTADVDGNYHFDNLAIALGQNRFSVQTTDALGNTNTFSTTVIRNSAPVNTTPIADVNVSKNAADQVIDLTNHFFDADVVNSVVRFNTNFGPVDVQLFDNLAPVTVANFVKYVEDDAYMNSIFHRLVKNFVLQGGGFDFKRDPSRINAIPTNPPTPDEPGHLNTRGTLAMAKLGPDPNSATSQWFFNLVDNPILDSLSAHFAAFGQVTAGLDVLDRIAALEIQNHGGVFGELPMQNYTGQNFPTDTQFNNYAGIYNLAVTRHSDRLVYTVPVNDNAGVVTASISGGQLKLHFAPGVTGTANITVQATDLTGQITTQTFQVNVT